MKIWAHLRLGAMSGRAARRISEEAEVDGDDDARGDGVAMAHGGLEAVALHGFERLFVEALSQVADNVRIGGAAVGIDDDGDHAHALKLVAARFIGEVGLRREERHRRGDVTAGRVDAIATVGAEADAMSGSYTVAITVADAAV